LWHSKSTNLGRHSLGSSDGPLTNHHRPGLNRCVRRRGRPMCSSSSRTTRASGRWVVTAVPSRRQTLISLPRTALLAVSVNTQTEKGDIMEKTDKRPNIVYFHIDNIGLGELSCYNGPAIRGAETKRIDEFAKEGLQSWHFCAESTMHSIKICIDDREISGKVRDTYCCSGWRRRRACCLGKNNGRCSFRRGLRNCMYREMAYRCRKRTMANRPWF